MITLNKIKLRYDNNLVLDINNFTFPKKGLVCITGPSGCGKTSLLNIIAGFIKEYEGEVIVNNKNIKQLSEEQLNSYHIKEVGILFQEFLLIESLTVRENILLPTNLIDTSSMENKNRKVKEILKFLHLNNYEKRFVNKLSGGEKQRVALARALINDPEILLCDEPTGALDEKNKNEVMKILSTIGKEKLVIVVSHDKKLINKYADEIINLEYGKITDVKELNNEKNTNKKALKLNFRKVSEKKPTNYEMFSLSKKINVHKKIRNIISILSISIGLLAIGIGSLLMSNIRNKIEKTFTNIYPENRVIVESNASSDLKFNVRSANIESCKLFLNSIHENTDNIGVIYHTDIDDFFLDLNESMISAVGFNTLFSSITINSFNEIVSLNDIEKEEIFPEFSGSLANDEIILNLSIRDYRLLHEIFNLQIQGRPIALGEKIKNISTQLIISVKNNEWGYEDSQIFNVVGVRRGTATGIINSNLRLAEKLFEDTMQLKSELNLIKKDQYPWTLKKSYFFSVNEQDKFLNEQLFNDHFLFELASSKHYKRLEEEYYRKRIIIYERPKNYPNFKNIMTDLLEEDEIYDFHLTSDRSYITFGNNLINGFLNPIYFASDEETLSNIISIDEERSEDFFEQIDIKEEGVASTSLTFDKKNNATFSALNMQNTDVLLENYDEIVISSGLSNKLFSTQESENEVIYLATEKSRFKTIDNKLVRDYVYKKLTVRAVVNDDNLKFYHNPNWPVIFYQNYVGLGPFNVIPSGFILNLSEDKVLRRDDILNLNKKYSEFSFYSPSSELLISVNETIHKLTSIIFVIASLSILVAFITVILIVYLSILDSKKDIFLLRLCGYSLKEVRTMFTFLGLSFGLKAIFIALIELVILNFVFDNVLNKVFYSTMMTISILPFIIVILVGLTLSLIAGFLASFSIKNESPLLLLKEEM